MFWVVFEKQSNNLQLILTSFRGISLYHMTNYTEFYTIYTNVLRVGKKLMHICYRIRTLLKIHKVKVIVGIHFKFD